MDKKRLLKQLADYLGNERTPIDLITYQELAKLTDKNIKEDIEGLTLPLLGLYGEIGSLLTEAKKQLREKDAYTHFQDHITEELGDCLWYLSNILSRVNVKLPVIAQRVFRETTDWDNIDEHFGNFGDLDSPEIKCIDPEERERSLLALAGRVGALLDYVFHNSVKKNRDAITSHLVYILSCLIEVAGLTGISIETAARRNLIKITDRWPINKRESKLFDDTIKLPPEERLPKKMDIWIEEKKSGNQFYVIQKVGPIIIGDRITDNVLDPDDYRFHDVFHWSYVAVLGWSPVIRRMLHCKRKSLPEKDENEDGARAAIIEEAVSAWIFQQAKRGRSYFKNFENIEYTLLKAIRELVTGFEAESIPLWQWENAILQGYSVFNTLRQTRKGTIRVDMNKRCITMVD